MPKASAKTEKSQSQKFKEAARATGCDEHEAAFEERLRKIAKATPPKSEDSKQRAKPHKARKAAKAS
jgi:hypothetical protein